MTDVNKMKKAELLSVIAEIDASVSTQAQAEKWKVADLREWLLNHEAEERTLSNTMKEYRQKYTKAKDYSGRSTLNNGDDLASALLPLSPDQTVALAEKVLDFADGELAERYAELNPGQRRMVCGNRLRAALKKEAITLKDVTKAIK